MSINIVDAKHRRTACVQSTSCTVVSHSSTYSQSYKETHKNEASLHKLHMSSAFRAFAISFYTIGYNVGRTYVLCEPLLVVIISVVICVHRESRGSPLAKHNKQNAQISRALKICKTEQRSWKGQTDKRTKIWYFCRIEMTKKNEICFFYFFSIPTSYPRLAVHLKRAGSIVFCLLSYQNTESKKRSLKFVNDLKAGRRGRVQVSRIYL